MEKSKGRLILQHYIHNYKLFKMFFLMAVLENLLNLCLFSFNRCMGHHSLLEIIQLTSPCVSDPNRGIFKISENFQDNKMKNSGSNCT